MKSRKRKPKSSSRAAESESDRDERNRAPRAEAARLGNQAVGALLRSVGERDETGTLGQQAVVARGRLDGEVARAIQERRGRGRSLPDRVRRDAESSFETDFSHVRVHTGDHAEELSRRLQAEAFTVGGDVFFAKDAYDPSDRSGRELLGHELAHTVQQGEAPGRPQRVDLPNDMAEREARRFGYSFATNSLDGRFTALAYGNEHTTTRNRPVSSKRRLATTPMVSRRTREVRETTDDEVLNRSLQRAETIAKLQERYNNLLKVAANKMANRIIEYSKAHQQFETVLEDADQIRRREEQANRLVRDILIGTIVSLINPAKGVALFLGMRTIQTTIRVQRRSRSWRQRMKQTSGDAVETFANESLAAVTNEAVNRSLSDSIDLMKNLEEAGVHPVYRSAITDLLQVIENFPNLMPLLQAELRLSMFANTVRSINNPELSGFLQWVDDQYEELITDLSDHEQPFLELAQAIRDAPDRTAGEIERMLWIEWVSHLRPPYDALNIKIIREHLAGLGLIHLFEGTHAPMTGQWSGEEIPSDDRSVIAVNARRAWLHSRGVSIGDSARPSEHEEILVNALYELGSARDALESEIAGQEGRIVERFDGRLMPHVLVNGDVYRIAPGSIREYRDGTIAEGGVTPKVGEEPVVVGVWPEWKVIRMYADSLRNDFLKGIKDALSDQASDPDTLREYMIERELRLKIHLPPR